MKRKGKEDKTRERAPHLVDEEGFCFKGLSFFRGKSGEEKQIVCHGMGKEESSRGRRENSVLCSLTSCRCFFLITLEALNKRKGDYRRTFNSP
jgi:hypothetical protein